MPERKMEKTPMFTKLATRKVATLTAALIIAAPLLAAPAGGGGGSSSSSSGGGSHGGGGSSGGGGSHGGVSGGTSHGNLGAHGAAMSTFAAAHGGVSMHMAATARATENHKPGGPPPPHLPHPVFNPNHKYDDYNFEGSEQYPAFITSCIPLPNAWSECDRPVKRRPHT
jgi:hypothetical protein